MNRLARLFWDRLSIYLPILLMGMAALATWWLVRGLPAPKPLDPSRAVRHEPDYTVNDLKLRSFDPDGRLKSELAGQAAMHYPDTDTLVLTDVRLKGYGQEGWLTVGRANTATSNRDGSSVTLSGAVRLERRTLGTSGAAKTTFFGEQLDYTRNPNRIRSDASVRVERGRDWFTANRMVLDDNAGTLVLDGAVKAQFSPRAQP